MAQNHCDNTGNIASSGMLTNALDDGYGFKMGGRLGQGFTSPTSTISLGNCFAQTSQGLPDATLSQFSNMSLNDCKAPLDPHLIEQKYSKNRTSNQFSLFAHPMPCRASPSLSRWSDDVTESDHSLYNPMQPGPFALFGPGQTQNRAVSDGLAVYDDVKAISMLTRGIEGVKCAHVRSYSHGSARQWSGLVGCGMGEMTNNVERELPVANGSTERMLRMPRHRKSNSVNVFGPMKDAAEGGCWSAAWAGVETQPAPLRRVESCDWLECAEGDTRVMKERKRGKRGGKRFRCDRGLRCHSGQCRRTHPAGWLPCPNMATGGCLDPACLASCHRERCENFFSCTRRLCCYAHSWGKPVLHNQTGGPELVPYPDMDLSRPRHVVVGGGSAPGSVFTSPTL